MKCPYCNEVIKVKTAIEKSDDLDKSLDKMQELAVDMYTKELGYKIYQNAMKEAGVKP